MLVDSHAHLLDHRFDGDRPQIIERAKKEGLVHILNVCEIEELEKGVELSRAYPGFIFTAAGVHPHNASSWSREKEKTIEEAASRKLIVAIGEIGLDFHYNFSPKQAQLDVFRRQMELAERLGLPVIIHSREADEETAGIIEEYTATGVLHSFTGGAELAERALAKGYYISFSGIVTFKNASSLRQVALRIPLDRLLVETDCPYLAPVPVRGRRNEPSFVRYTARFLADLRSEDQQEFALKTTENFRKLFVIAAGETSNSL